MAPIAHDDFNEFRMMLDDQLHLLLDILYQNRNLLRDAAFDNQLVQLRVNLVLLASEQIEPNEFFQTEQKILVTSLDKLMADNLQHFDETVMGKVIQSYKVGLSKASWKKQFGMFHGFPKFCEVLLKEKAETVDCDLVMFILSVGSNLVAHYEPRYKTIGFKIYRHLMELGDKSLFKEMNIHQVIYSECFPMLRKSSDIDFNDHLYDCLLHAVLIDGSTLKTSQWSNFDDVFGELLTQVGHESDGRTAMLLLKKVVKFCGSSYVDKDEQPDLTSEMRYEELKARTKDANHRTLRWIKKLMEMMIRESSRLLSFHGCLQVLDAFHSIYIESIFNVDAKVLGRSLTDFNKKLILVVMQSANTHQHEPNVLLALKQFLKTIAQHQNLSQDLVICLEKILNHETFQ